MIQTTPRILDDVCELIVDCEHKTAPIQPTGYPSIRTPNIGRGRLILDNVNRVSEETYKSWTKRAIPQADDLILAREAPVGNVAIVPQNLKVCLGQRTVLIRSDKQKVEPHFLLYLLLGDEIQGKIQSISNGATVHHFNMKDIRNLELPLLPSPQTQRKISSTLSTYDDLIENNTRRIKILEEMSRMIYREWFVNFRYPGHEQVKLVDSPLGRIPKGWEVKTFEDVALNFDRLRKPLSSIQRESRKGPYPYYGAAKVFDYIDDYIFDGEYLLIAEDGSVITPDRKPVLQMTSGKFWANNHTHIVQGKQPVSTEFLYLCLSELDISGYVTGAAQPKITQANMNRIPVLVPKLALLESFNGKVRAFFSQIKLLEKKNNNLRQTRDLLLPKLISGEVEV